MIDIASLVTRPSWFVVSGLVLLWFVVILLAVMMIGLSRSITVIKAVHTVVLVLNGWRCPLTAMAENLGSKHGQITDTLLPKWFADRVFRIYSILYVGAVLLLVVRLLG